MIRRILWRLLLEQGGWSRIWYGLATAMVIAGGGLIYHETRPPAGDCAWPTCFPDTNNTGVPVGTNLTNYTGPAVITTPDTVVDSKNITQCIGVATTGVVIKNSRITCDGNGVGGYPCGSPNGAITIWHSSSPDCPTRFDPYSLTVQDSEIICSPLSAGSTGVTGDTFTMLRVYVTDCENMASIDNDVTVQDSYDIEQYNQDDAHADGLQFGCGANDVNIIHNTIYNLGIGGTYGQLASAINACSPHSNWLIEHNKLGGGGYTVRCVDGATGTNWIIRNNSFVNNYDLAYSTQCADETQSGNIKFEDGTPITLG